MVYWSKKEIDFLKRNYSSKGNYDLAKKLNRTKGSVYGKGRGLGLKKSKKCISKVHKQGVENWKKRDPIGFKNHQSCAGRRNFELHPNMAREIMLNNHKKYPEKFGKKAHEAWMKKYPKEMRIKWTSNAGKISWEKNREIHLKRMREPININRLRKKMVKFHKRRLEDDELNKQFIESCKRGYRNFQIRLKNDKELRERVQKSRCEGGKKAVKIMHKKTEERRKSDPIFNKKYLQDKSRAGKISITKFLENSPYIYKNQRFMSKSELLVAKFLDDFNIMNICSENIQIPVGNCFVDFKIDDKKLFIEYHPPSEFMNSNMIFGEEYYNNRRKLLDENGFLDYSLIVLEGISELQSKVFPLFNIGITKGELINMIKNEWKFLKNMGSYGVMQHA